MGKGAGGIALPTGGGALQGLGEKFAADPFTGTGQFQLPFTIPPGRGGFTPSLGLAYRTTHGNGPYGLGWSLDVGSIARKMAGGIPTFDDNQDTFIYSSAEDLVPVPGGSGAQRYRPRTEGLFARIEHHLSATTDHWEVWSKNGYHSYYGTPNKKGNDPAVLAKPTNRQKVLSWHLTRTVDLFGNRMEYDYLRDAVNQQGSHHWDQLYLSRVRYVDYGPASANQFLVSVRFLYETRPDPFSHYRAGFEIRTVQRCKQVEVWSHPGPDLLIRAYDLIYLDQRTPLPPLPPNGVSLLSQVVMEGHDGATSVRMPPLEFTYSGFSPGTHDFFPVTGPAMPVQSLTNPQMELADLFGNGMPDLFEMGATIRYWRNLGNGTFDWPRAMDEAPEGVTLGDPTVMLLDANGDGRLDLLVNRSDVSGYYSTHFGGSWDRHSFRPYKLAPTFGLKDPDVHLTDLDGDGVVDAIRSGTRFECFLNDPAVGWKQVRAIERGNLADFPNVNFSDPRVKWADMSGDGLQDIVLIHGNRIDYWPNLGFGNWGKRVTMHPAPTLPYDYDPRRVLLGDIDGDGLADLVYVDDRRVTVWMNQGGNGFGEPTVIQGTPPVSGEDAVRLVDLLGTGVPGVLWSAEVSDLSHAAMFFLDFTGGEKPYLMTGIKNHLGAETRLTYKSSTEYFLQDQLSVATRWKTSLPFPVQVISHVEILDAITGGRLTAEYHYRNGYWDGAEREFRGFGSVTQWDTEVITGVPDLSPPVETRRWYHLGPVGDESGTWEELDFSAEYWSGDPVALERPAEATALLKALPLDARRDAIRTLRGGLLRQEIYAVDGTPLAARPYTVSENIQSLREEAPPTAAEGDRARLFYPFAIANRETQWERGAEPMTRFHFMLSRDAGGQVLRQMDVAVPRGRDFRVNQPGSAPYLSSYAESQFLKRDDAGGYFLDRVAKTSSFEVMNNGTPSVAALRDAVVLGTATTVLFHETLNYYDGAAFQGLPFGQVGDYGVISRTENRCLTEDILTQAYGADRPPYMKPTGSVAWTPDYPEEFRTGLLPLAGFVHHAGSATASPGYYVMMLRNAYDFQKNPGGIIRGFALVSRDAMGADTSVQMDAFDYLPSASTDAAGLTTTASYDYRAMMPRESQDSNGNRHLYTYTPLGLLSTSAVMGKGSEAVGDTAAKPSLRHEYDFHAFDKTGQPIQTRTFERRHHAQDTGIPAGEADAEVSRVSFSDGFGRIVQTRAQAEPVVFGDAVHGDAGLSITVSDPIVPAVGVTQSDRVLVSAWTIYDNKGRVIEKYEPFFSTGWTYNPPTDSERGQKMTCHYDPRGQVLRSRLPDGSEQRMVYGIPSALTTPEVFTPTPWETYTYDANDNAGRTHPTESAAYNTHWNTPTSILVDALGRVIQTTCRQGPAPADALITTSSYDIQGNVLTTVDVLGRTTSRHVYDLSGQPLRLETLDAGVRWTVYNAGAAIIEHRDGKGSCLLSSYDALHRITRRWGREDAASAMTLRERYVYADASDSGLTRAQAAGLNLLGSLLQQYDEAGALTTIRRDFKGNVLARVRRVVKDSVVLAGFSSAPGAGWNVPTAQVDWTLSPGETLASRAAALLDSTAYETNITFDALGHAKTMTYPNDVTGKRRVTELVYGPSGSLQQIRLDGKLMVEGLAHNAKGQRVLIAYANGIMTRHAYDPVTTRLRRLRSERYTRVGASTYKPTGAPLMDTSHAYDLVGNILRLREDAPESGIPGSPEGQDALDRLFTYDPFYRLTFATGRESDVPWSTPPWLDQPKPSDPTKTRRYQETYSYDAAGNLTQLHHQAGAQAFKRTWTLAAGCNRIATLGVTGAPIPYHYDANGNIDGESSSRHFSWERQDRLQVYRTQTAGSEPSVYVRYLYDASGLRVKKCVRKQGGAVESTVYIENTFEHETWQGGSNNLIHLSIGATRMAHLRVGPAHPGDISPANQFFIGDHRGSGVLALDDSGGWINREEFTPFGETCFGSYVRKRYRFAGKERDEESGLDYFGLRYYASWHCRWMTPDPAGLREGLNLYAFVRGNPLNHVDPSGTEDHADDYLDAGVPTPAEKASGTARVSEEVKQETHGTSLPGGTVDQPSASKGIQAIETNKHANTFAKKETIKGVKVGTAAFFSQNPLQMADNLLFMGLMSASIDVALGKPGASGLSVKMEGADTELSQNVAGATFGAWCTLATIGTGVVAELGMQNAAMRFNAAQLRLKPPSLIAGEGASGTTSDGRVTVYRFHDVANPETLKPNLSREPTHVQVEEAGRMADNPQYGTARGEWHARGITEKSPYVSLLTDPAAGANTYDPWLKAIVTGAPMPAHMGGRTVARAPHLSIFRVPKERLYYPKYELSIRETEVLFLGDDLHMFQVDALPNPYTHTPLPVLTLPRVGDR